MKILFVFSSFLLMKNRKLERTPFENKSFKSKKKSLDIKNEYFIRVLILSINAL